MQQELQLQQQEALNAAAKAVSDLQHQTKNTNPNNSPPRSHGNNKTSTAAQSSILNNASGKNDANDSTTVKNMQHELARLHVENELLKVQVQDAHANLNRFTTAVCTHPRNEYCDECSGKE